MVPLIIAGAAAGLAGQLGGAAISGYYADKASEREANARKEAANKLLQQGQITDTQYQQLINQINQYYATRGSLGTKQDVNQYKAAIQGYNPEDYVADVGNFDYDKTQEDFVNPYYSQIIADTRDTIQHSAAGAGLGRGTGAALNIAKGTAEKSDELYRTAQEAYRDDGEEDDDDIPGMHAHRIGIHDKRTLRFPQTHDTVFLLQPAEQQSDGNACHSTQHTDHAAFKQEDTYYLLVGSS
jgi:hypothetical protein